MKLSELAANHAYETTYFNLVGEPMNPGIKFQHHPITLKKVREFFMKNPIIKTFLQGMDKKDERVFV